MPAPAHYFVQVYSNFKLQFIIFIYCLWRETYDCLKFLLYTKYNFTCADASSDWPLTTTDHPPPPPPSSSSTTATAASNSSTSSRDDTTLPDSDNESNSNSDLLDFMFF